LFLFVLELPGPGWARRSRRRGQGLGGARPRRGRRALTATPVGACCSGQGDRKGLCGFRVLFGWWVVVVFRAGFPGAGQAERAAGHSFATCWWHEAVRRDGRSGSIRGATSPDWGVMTWAIRADREPCAHAAGGERCRARTW
jgi:hypothetical protein